MVIVMYACDVFLEMALQGTDLLLFIFISFCHLFTMVLHNAEDDPRTFLHQLLISKIPW